MSDIFDSKERLFCSEVDSLFLDALVMFQEMYQNTDTRMHQYFNGYAIVVINAINEHLFEEMHRFFLESIQDELSLTNLPVLNIKKIMDILFRHPDNCIRDNHKGGIKGFEFISKEIHGLDSKNNPIIKVNNGLKHIAKLSKLIEGSKQGNPPYFGFNFLRNSIAHNSNILDYSRVTQSFFLLKKNVFKNGNMNDLDFLEKTINSLKAGFKELANSYFDQCRTLYL